MVYSLSETFATIKTIPMCKKTILASSAKLLVLSIYEFCLEDEGVEKNWTCNNLIGTFTIQKDNFDFSGKVASTVNTVFAIHNLRPK